MIVCVLHIRDITLGATNMKKLKDFFYDKNDIIIVLLIVAIAALIIYTRIDSIMSYPAEYASKAAATEKKETTEITQAPETEETVGEDVTIVIEDSDTSSAVADKLYEAGLIDSAEDFESFVSSAGKSDAIQSGTFQIPSGSSHEEILDIIT